MTVWIPGEADGEAQKRHAPATLRNRDAILAVLGEALPSSGLVLEVASGSGEHAVHFAAALPALDWQPSDPDPAALASIEAWREEAGLANLRAPILLDAAADWLIDRVDAMVCINMVHISPWAATVGLFTNGARLLPKDAPLILYGPYFQADVVPAPSNVEFDASLRARDPRWGIRALEDIAALATTQGFALDCVEAMPANNLTLIFRRI